MRSDPICWCSTHQPLRYLLRSATYDGIMEILKAHSPYGIQVRFSKWALGEHASEAGAKVA